MCFCQGWNAAWIRFTATQTFNRIAHNSKRGPQMRCFLFYCTQLFDLFVLTVVFKPKVCGRPRAWEFQRESFTWDWLEEQMKTSWYGCLGSSSRVCLRAKALNKHQLWPGSIRRYASYCERRISIWFYPGQECNVFIML